MFGQTLVWFLIGTFCLEWVQQGLNLYSILAATYFGIFGFVAFFVARFLARNPFQYFALSAVIFFVFRFGFIISNAHDLHMTLKRDGMLLVENGTVSFEGMLYFS